MRADQKLALQFRRLRIRRTGVTAVSSRNSRARIEDGERGLVDGTLDGVVCVDMFGEGSGHDARAPSFRSRMDSSRTRMRNAAGKP